MTDSTAVRTGRPSAAQPGTRQFSVLNEEQPGAVDVGRQAGKASAEVDALRTGQ